MYTGRVDITDSNIKELLQAADYLQIESLKEQCSKYLHFGPVTVKNCVGLCLLGTMYNLEYLFTRALNFLNSHLFEVLEEDEVLTLTSESLMDFLTNDSLSYVPVEKFFYFLVKWLECDPKQRDQYFPDLFCQLNLARVTKEFLNNDIEKNSYVLKSKKCQAHISDHKDKLLAGVKTQETVEKDVIIVTGGLRKDPIYGTDIVDAVYAYIPVENRWVQLPPLPRRVSKPLVASDGFWALYVVDSGSRFDIKQLFFKFQPETMEWFEMRVSLPPQLIDPCLEQIACAAGKIIVMVSSYTMDAGVRRWCCHLVELDESKKELEIRCRLFNRGMTSQFRLTTTADRYVCVCAWKLKDKVGRNPSGRHLAKFVYYDAELGILFDRSRGAFFQPVMYAMNNEVVITKPGRCNARSFNTNSRKWRQRREFGLPLMAEEPDRTDFCYCYHKGHLYMFGGKNQVSKGPIDSAVRYNIEKKDCEPIAAMPIAVMNAACCIMTLPTDMLRCPLECPHCKIKGRRQMAQYHRDYSDYTDDDDDDDDDFYDYDDDDEIYEEWDDVNFDNSSIDDNFGPPLYLY